MAFHPVPNVRCGAAAMAPVSGVGRLHPAAAWAAEKAI